MNLCAPYSTSLLFVIIITNYDNNIRYDHFLLTIIIINQLSNFLFGSDFVLSFEFNAYKEIQQDISSNFVGILSFNFIVDFQENIRLKFGFNLCDSQVKLV